jgi:hypothetical protein
VSGSNLGGDTSYNVRLFGGFSVTLRISSDSTSLQATVAPFQILSSSSISITLPSTPSDTDRAVKQATKNPSTNLDSREKYI